MFIKKTFLKQNGVPLITLSCFVLAGNKILIFLNVLFQNVLSRMGRIAIAIVVKIASIRHVID